MVDENDIWLFVYEMEEASFTEIEDHFVGSGKCAHNTCSNYRESLEAAGKIKKRLSERTGDKVYFVPQLYKQELEALKAKRKYILDIAKLPPERQADIFTRLEGKNELYKRQQRLDELESLPLPTRSVVSAIQKMKRELGWRVKRRRDPNYKLSRPWTILDKAGRKIDIEKFSTYDGPAGLLCTPAKVTLKITDPDYDDFQFQYAPDWKLLFTGKIMGKKKMLIGAYTELLELRKKDIEDQATSWKEKLGVKEPEWQVKRPQVLEMIELQCTSEEIVRFLAPDLLDQAKAPKLIRVRLGRNKEYVDPFCPQFTLYARSNQSISPGEVIIKKFEDLKIVRHEWQARKDNRNRSISAKKLDPTEALVITNAKLEKTKTGSKFKWVNAPKPKMRWYIFRKMKGRSMVFYQEASKKKAIESLVKEYRRKMKLWNFQKDYILSKVEQNKIENVRISKIKKFTLGGIQNSGLFTDKISSLGSGLDHLYCVHRKAVFCSEEYEFGVKVLQENREWITRIKYTAIPR